MQKLLQETTTVALSRTRRDPSFWPRKRLSEPRVREFTEIYRHHGRDGIDPIVVTPADLDGEYLVLDGWHRIGAALDLGWGYLPAVIRPVASDQEAYEVAVRLSSRGPRPMTRAEKRDAVDRLLEMDPRRGDRCIAEIAGVSHPFVAERRRLLGRPSGSRESQSPTADRYAISLMKPARSMYDTWREGREVATGRDAADNAGGTGMALVLAGAAEKCCGGQAEIWLVRLAEWALEARPWLKSNRE